VGTKGETVSGNFSDRKDCMMGEIQRTAAAICPGLIARARATANKTHLRLQILQIRSGIQPTRCRWMACGGEERQEGGRSMRGTKLAVMLDGGGTPKDFRMGSFQPQNQWHHSNATSPI
jgi:hypothetical protein